MSLLLALLACGEPEPGGEAPAPAVYLNEIMAYNVDGELDDHGEADDWFEIQVPADVALDGWTVILDEEGAEPFALDGIGAGFAVVVADGTPEQGPLHAPFTLVPGGGALLLLDGEGGLVQQVRWPVAHPDVSWARVAGDDWTFAFEPSPGEVNDL